MKTLSQKTVGYLSLGLWIVGLYSLSLCNSRLRGKKRQRKFQCEKIHSYLEAELRMEEEEKEEEEEEEDQDEKAVLEKVFALSSSSSESEHEDATYTSDSDPPSCDWEPVHQVKGLWLCRNFLSPNQQSLLLSAIQAQDWFTRPNTNQAMRFGDLPPWAHHLSNSIRRSLLLEPSTFSSPLPLPHHLLSREPLFDQMIANLYHPGEGICAHVDLMRFEDGIVIVSLESSCVMHFTPVDENGSGFGSVPVLLTPGSLVVMSGDARYNWKHEINRRPGFQVWEGKELEQSRRISITLRKLCPNP